MDLLKQKRKHLEENNYKEIVEKFMKTTCERDMPCLPNQVQPPLRHQQIFNEINLFVSYYKQYEHAIKKALDTPIKMMQIFRVAKSYDYKKIFELQGLINYDTPKQDYEKLEAFEKQILTPIKVEIKFTHPQLSNPFNIFQCLFDQNYNMQEFIQNVNFQDLIACLEILDQ